MNIQEITANGLSREIKITIGKDELTGRLDDKINELKDNVQLRGFRKGKVPPAHIKKIYGQRVMGEIVQELVSTHGQKALTERNERPALQPEIKLAGETEEMMRGEADLVFDMVYDIIPPIKLADFSKIKLERRVAEIVKKDVQDAITRLAESRKNFASEEKGGAAAQGDRVKIDFIGRIDGEAFEGGAAQGTELELGSGQFIPGFEEQLIGAKAGAKLDVKVTFPKDYGNADLAGKEAVFEVTLHAVNSPQKVEINDEFAKTLGLESLKNLEENVRTRIADDYGQLTRQHLKRHLLDQLADLHEFELPEKMVTLEFDQIWQQFEQELTHQGKKITELDESEETLRAEYRDIAIRRVRTGLILAEIGSQNKIEVSQDEVNQGLMQRVQQFPGQEKQVFEYFRSNPEAMAQIRAPIFEDKVIDFIVEQADVSETVVPVAELLKEPEEVKPAKKGKSSAKKPAAKKSESKKPAAKKAESKKPAAKKPAAKKAPAKKKPAKK